MSELCGACRFPSRKARKRSGERAFGGAEFPSPFHEFSLNDIFSSRNTHKHVIKRHFTFVSSVLLPTFPRLFRSFFAGFPSDFAGLLIDFSGLGVFMHTQQRRNQHLRNLRRSAPSGVRYLFRFLSDASLGSALPRLARFLLLPEKKQPQKKQPHRPRSQAIPASAPARTCALRRTPAILL